MGLKTTNYKVEKLNLLLPQAYAYIIKCEANRTKGEAILGIFASREDAENPNIEPYETKKISFLVDRDKNDRISAYIQAKGQSYKPHFNTSTMLVELTLYNEYFYGWEDDIQ